MTTETNQASQSREIPVPPGGGSWRFDEAAWQWVSNDQAPAETMAPDAPAVALDTEAAVSSEE